MCSCKRGIAIVVLVLGVASIVLGVLFMTQVGPAKDEVAASIQPVTLATLDATYDTVKAKQEAIKAVEEPKIQAGQAMPSAMYNYLSIQRTGLGAARTSVGLADFMMYSGIVDIVLGAGLLLAGVALFKKDKNLA